MEIRIKNLTKVFPGDPKKHIRDTIAVKDLDIVVPDGKLVGLLGPSGCGKCRKVESPKRKKRRHVLFVAEDDTRLSNKIKCEEKITNSELRRTLASYREEVYPDQEG